MGLCCVSGFHSGLDAKAESGSAVGISLVKEVGLRGFILVPLPLRLPSSQIFHDGTSLWALILRPGIPGLPYGWPVRLSLPLPPCPTPAK